jgi:hypothetical protein
MTDTHRYCLSNLVSLQRMIDEILQDLLQIRSSNALIREHGTYLIQLSTGVNSRGLRMHRFNGAPNGN